MPTPALLVSRKPPSPAEGFDRLISEPIVDVSAEAPSGETSGAYVVHVETAHFGASVYLDRATAARLAARLAAMLAE